LNIIFPESIKEKSVVVIGSPRTGSTAFCIKLAKDLGIPYYHEIFRVTDHPNYNDKIIERISNYWDNQKNGERTLVRYFPSHRELTPEETDSVFNNSFVINLKRKNLVQQISSFYLVQQTQKSRFYIDEEVEENWKIKINEDLVKFAIERILFYIKESNIRELRADMTLYYEDIKSELTNGSIKPYPKPVNYGLLKKRVIELLPDYLD